MGGVRAFLRHAKLTQYVNACEEEGYDELTDMLDLLDDADAFSEMVEVSISTRILG